MEERLFALLEAAAALRRQLGLRLDRPRGPDGLKVDTLYLVLQPGLEPALARVRELFAGLVSTELCLRLRPQVADPALIDRLIDDLFRRLPPVLDRLSQLCRTTPESRSPLGKKEVTRLCLRGLAPEGPVDLDPARVEDMVRLYRDVHELSLLALAWKRELSSRLSGRLQVHILGIGEITTTIEVKGRHWHKIHPTEKRRMRLCYKRLPAFPDREQALRYMGIHSRYQELLGELGIATPWHDNLSLRRPDGKWVVYNRQERFHNRRVACLVIRDLDADGCVELFRRLLGKLRPLFLANRGDGAIQLGMDAQIPNWVLPAYRPDRPRLAADEPMLYIDTSTPLFRVGGVEQLDTDLFLKSVPALFRPLLKYTLLPGIVDRYYRPREVVIDLIASYIVHGRPDVAGGLVGIGNRFLAEAGLAGKPLTLEEIKKYNRQDVVIWNLFRRLKRLDRFLTERLLGGEYEQRLPSGPSSRWENLVGVGGMGLTPEDERTED
jgi:hypothetical protein